ncbi:hypothetical protein B7463_g10866, partial [Scytalidium lignicola]
MLAEERHRVGTESDAEPKKLSVDNLDNNHREAITRAISNILLTEVAEINRRASGTRIARLSSHSLLVGGSNSGRKAKCGRFLFLYESQSVAVKLFKVNKSTLNMAIQRGSKPNSRGGYNKILTASQE